MSFLNQISKDSINLVALASIQGSNALVPLLIFPVALARLGTDGFAQIVLAEAISVIALVVCLYSFEIEGVIKVSRLRHSGAVERIGEVYSEIMFARLFLFAISLAGVCAICLATHPDSLPVVAVFMLAPLGYVLQSAWLYQALERNIPLAAITVLCRCASVVVVLVFVRSKSDVLLVPLAIGGGAAAAGLASLLFVRAGIGVKFRGVPPAMIAESLWSGRAIFFGNVFVALYRDSNVLLLGTLGMSGAVVSTYALAEKVTKCVQAVVRPINQLFFPKALRVLGVAARPSIELAGKIWKLTWPQLLLAFIGIAVGGLLYWIARDKIAFLRTLPERGQIEVLVSLMLCAVFVGVANFMYGMVSLNALNEKGFFALALLITGVSSVLLCLVMAHSLEGVGAAIAFVVSECLLLAQVLSRFGLHRQ